ncbi:hypothetical protein SVIOM74S_04825 [Streptomyces violarus]
MDDRRAGSYRRSGSSPPSPVLDLPPSWFMAMARVSCASCEMEPYDMAPVENRLTISETGSTSSTGMGFRSDLKPNRPRSVISRSDCSFTRSVYFLKMS